MNVLNLFKYYAPKYNGHDNLSFYSQGSIYFQKPTKFNDPWDCKAPPITNSSQINSLKDIWFNLEGQNDPANAENAWQIIERGGNGSSLSLAAFQYEGKRYLHINNLLSLQY